MPVPEHEAQAKHADVDLTTTVERRVPRYAGLDEDELVELGFMSRHAVVGRRVDPSMVLDSGGVYRETLLDYLGPTVGGVAKKRPLSAALAQIAARVGLPSEQPAARARRTVASEALGQGAALQIRRKLG